LYSLIFARLLYPFSSCLNAE